MKEFVYSVLKKEKNEDHYYLYSVCENFSIVENLFINEGVSRTSGKKNGEFMLGLYEDQEENEYSILRSYLNSNKHETVAFEHVDVIEELLESGGLE